MTSPKINASDMTLAERLIIAREAKGLKQYQLAKLVGIAQQSLQAIEKGQTKQPRLLKKIAEVLETTPEWLQFNAGLPPEYLNESLASSLPPEGKVPLLEWHQVLTWMKTFDLNQFSVPFKVGSRVGEPLSKHVEFIAVPDKKNNKQFALRVRGDSMVASATGKRTFLEGDIIVVDPEQEPQNGSFVVALQKHADEAIFKQYVIDGRSQYLRPLNPQYPLISMDDSPSDIHICGVVVAHLDVLV